MILFRRKIAGIFQDFSRLGDEVFASWNRKVSFCEKLSNFSFGRVCVYVCVCYIKKIVDIVMVGIREKIVLVKWRSVKYEL